MSERSEAKRDGARQQKNSGRGKIQKGDAVWKSFLVDYKEYPSGFRITPAQWSKTCMDALKHSLWPVLKVIMGGGRHKVRLAVIEWELLEYYEGLREELEELKATIQNRWGEYD